MHYPTFLPALVLLGVLGACTDRQATTAPDAGPRLDVAAAPADLTVTDLATGEELVVAAGVEAERAATGGRATGHADVTSGPRHATSSFSALSTGDFPNARGQWESHVTGPFGHFEVHVSVDCLAIAGNNAWFSGPVTKWRFNGQDLLPGAPGIQALFRVQDNGEGGTTVDMASLGVAAFRAQLCRSMRLLPLLPSDNGNIQVSQR